MARPNEDNDEQVKLINKMPYYRYNVNALYQIGYRKICAALWHPPGNLTSVFRVSVRYTAGSMHETHYASAR